MKQVIQITYQILIALRHIHSMDVWHRDLKPANVLIFEDGTAKICDFGLARSVEDEGEKKKTVAPKGLLNIPKSDKLQKKKMNKDIKLKNVLTSHVVTRWYRAPELILIEKNYNHKIDVWSLGCILGELI